VYFGDSEPNRTDLASGTTYNVGCAGAVIEKNFESDEPEWLASPANVYDADAVFAPTAVLLAYTGVGVNDKPPAPVTDTAHGVTAAPVYTTDAGHVTTVVDGAKSIEKNFESDEPEWFASPTNVYDADAVFVPTAVLLAYTGVGVNDKPPAPVTDTVHGVNAAPVYTTDAGHVTTVVDGARPIVRFAVAVVSKVYEVSEPPEHEIVTGDDVTEVLVA